MPTWLLIAQGPFARFTLAVCLLGLLRLLLLTIWEMVRAVQRAGDKRIPYGRIFWETLTWLLPINRLHRTRGLYSYASFSFHLGVLIAAPFLANHIDLMHDISGLRWTPLWRPLADTLTACTILAGTYLLLHRLYNAGSRQLSHLADYLLLSLILSIFTSGFIAGQAWNPLPYEAVMLFHTVSGFALLLIIPFSKIAHCILYPLIRLGSEIAWRFLPQGGSQVIEHLYGPQGRHI